MFPTSTDPCTVTVATATGVWQLWYCHAGCFTKRLFKRDDGLFDPAHF
jgi:hypothetical protein